MKKLFICLSVALAVPLAFGTAFGDSAKNTCEVSYLTSVGVKAGGINLASSAEVAALPWTTIFEKEIHCANNKDIFVDVSLEVGLYTRTKAKSQQGSTDTATADAGLRVRVVLDQGTANERFFMPDHGALLLGVEGSGPTPPGTGVSFARRYQELSAKLQGILTCPEGSAIPGDCTFEDEEIELILSTLDAHSFNFIIDDVSSGIHTITVEAVAITDKSTEADAAAYAGAGSMVVEEVRMVKEDPVEL